MATPKPAMPQKGSASNVEEIYAKVKDAMRYGKACRNLVFTKKELDLLLADMDQSESLKTKLMVLQQEMEYIERVVSAQQSRGAMCSVKHLKAILETVPDNLSDRCSKVFNLVVFKETMKLAIQELLLKSKTAGQVDVGKMMSSKPVFYNLLKPKIRKLKFNFDKELENITKVSYWISEHSQDHSPNRQQTRQSPRKVVAKTPRPSGKTVANDSTGLSELKQCNDLLDKHQAVAKVPSYSRDLKLVDKLNLLVEELDGHQKHREQTTHHEMLGNAPASYLLADGDDEADCSIVVPHHQSSEYIKTLSEKKKRIMTANSEDMITLVVCKQLTSTAGQWKELYRKLMSTKYSNGQIEDDITAITDKPRSEKTQAFEALKIWRQAFGRSLKTDLLKNELESLRRQDIVLNICDYEQRLSSGRLDPTALCAVCRHCFY